MAPVVHIIDDDASFRVAIARLLKESGYDARVYDSAAGFVESCADDGPCCLLLDMQMPGISGSDLQEKLRQQQSIIPIVFVTGHGDIPTSVRAIKNGAEDFLTKPVAREDLLAALERALSRHREAQRKAVERQATEDLLANLTPKETAVFALVVRGKLNKQIAHELGSAVRTVKSHRHSIMEKLKVRSWAEAVLIAERAGIIGSRDA